MEPQIKTKVKASDVNLNDAITYAQLIATVHAVFYGVGNTKDNPGKVTNPSLSAYQKAIKDACDPNSVNYDPSVYPGFLEDYQLLHNIQMTDFATKKTEKDIPVYYGFIAKYLKSPYNYVVAIRGTETQMEFEDDEQLDLQPFTEVSNGGKVIRGFHTIYQTIVLLTPPDADKDASSKVLLKDVAAKPSIALRDAGKVPTVVTGHSLGAALATMYAAQAANSPGNSGEMIVYTYASPKVGDADFVKMYNNSVQENYRIYNTQDDVPKQPYLWGQHVDDGYPLDSSQYPEIVGSKNCNDLLKCLGCAHVLPTYLYMLETKNGSNPAPAMLNAEGNSCWNKTTK
ncbi:lipase family protein [Chitinophaga japonensis]|uniref:Lipase (Class 3) n=1 Tax=Chitinophaga japonensis TaxID=104662 RepID=A0A562TAS0_CHIJA|nr:lipase family protein [Chitinophaga japonensis]TWI90719.1 lipase (class 3) [Chitinophaga japonensis]